jgi:hypothetical protein
MHWIPPLYRQWKEIPRDIVFLSAIALMFFAPRFGGRLFQWIEHWGSRLAGQRLRVVLGIGLAAVAIRLCLLWVMPVPAPRIHDEFSYLLGADTLAHGRLTNPPHPLWQYFDTFHVNQAPTYMSKYPPAAPAVLALGQILGNPWFGVLLSSGAMCAAVVWMLQGWFPPRWALLGGILILFRLGIFSYWANSYWGGALPAFGGALATGALPRLIRSWRARDAFILGFGAIILANSRPFEGAVLCLPIFAVLLFKLSTAGRPSGRTALVHVAAPVALVGLLGVVFMAYYNWRGTGSALLPPYVLNERTYLAGTPALLWQKRPAPLHYANPQFEIYYNEYVRSVWSNGRVTGLFSAFMKPFRNLLESAYLFLWPELVVPLLALPWILRSGKGRFLFVQVAMVFAAVLATVWFAPHYLSPLTASLFGLLILGIRHLRLWRVHGQPAGIGLSRAVVVLAILLSPFNYRGDWRSGTPEGIAYRATFARQLGGLPGEHLVIVHYTPDHNVTQEWVYNGADIDHSKVVWAREIPGRDLQPLLSYFRGRRVWVAEPDASPPRLIPFPGSTQ